MSSNEQGQNTSTKAAYLEASFTGNILLFYAFDVGDSIDLDMVRERNLVLVRSATPSSYFKSYHTPLSFHLVEPDGSESDCMIGSLYQFGVLSLWYRIPFSEPFNQIEQKLIETHRKYGKKSEADAQLIYQRIVQAIRNPMSYHLKNDYFVVQVHPPKEKISGEEFKECFGSKIASILRLETQNLSEYQKDDILASTTGYYGQDLIIIDSKASFVYDDEYSEAVEFFELANVQQLELQFFDRLLYEKLNFFYGREAFEIPWKAYLPLVGRRLDLSVSQLAKLRVEISVITERLENSINMVGDAYYSKLYDVLIEKLSLRTWRESIEKKLNIIQDIHSIYQNHLHTVLEEMLTVVIILLIALEAFGTFFH